jgi:nitronate monooxygenase
LFGCRYPLQSAGIGGLRQPDLALAVARAGGIGMLSGVEGRDALRPQLEAVPPGTAVGANFLVPFLQVDAVEEAAARVPYVELFYGEPDAALVDRIRQGGARAGWQVGSVDEARAAADAGCDVVVAQGIEAGGHVRGTVELHRLLPAVRAAVDVAVIGAGGIGTAAQVAAALQGGADGVRVGTRFLAAREARAHPVYVDALIGAGAADTVVTTRFDAGWPGAPHRVLRSAIEAGERRGDAQVWSPLWPTADDTGPVEAMALYAGTSVDAVERRQSAAEIVAELVGA